MFSWFTKFISLSGLVESIVDPGTLPMLDDNTIYQASEDGLLVCFMSQMDSIQIGIGWGNQIENLNWITGLNSYTLPLNKGQYFGNYPDIASSAFLKFIPFIKKV